MTTSLPVNYFETRRTDSFKNDIKISHAIHKSLAPADISPRTCYTDYSVASLQLKTSCLLRWIMSNLSIVELTVHCYLAVVLEAEKHWSQSLAS